ASDMRLAWAIACLSLACPCAANAAENSATTRPIDLFDLAAPAFTTFSEPDGVPGSVTVGVQTDRDGYVWAASTHGLARYDGRRWNATGAPVAGGLIGNLLVDHDGTLWASFRDRGVAEFDGTNWHFEVVDSGLATNHVRRLTETVDAEGRYELWAAT